MALAVACTRCGAIVAAGNQCQQCSPTRREERRRTDEPWRRVYTLKPWKRCRLAVLERDGHRCRVTERGVRCGVKTKLHGHHHPSSLEEIWVEAQREGWTWDEFVRAACDPNQVITTCAGHNNALDAARRKARA